ncbi:VOC family protein [Streptomyces sp. NPDC048304]|uniref:VOC family protein n=1 Tax=Streptomyces sp. NPDC048304 TaxID=3154820 RepID=UPI0033E214AD
MTLQRIDNVGIVVEDLDAAVAFFTELGMEVEGKAQIEGLFADQAVGRAGPQGAPAAFPCQVKPAARSAARTVAGRRCSTRATTRSATWSRRHQSP